MGFNSGFKGLKRFSSRVPTPDPQPTVLSVAKLLELHKLCISSQFKFLFYLNKLDASLNNDRHVFSV